MAGDATAYLKLKQTFHEDSPQRDRLKSLENEQWREYETKDGVYRISNPLALLVSESGTHYVIDTDYVVHCFPADGFVLRWKNCTDHCPINFGGV